jgi:hypothetical protein
MERVQDSAAPSGARYANYLLVWGSIHQCGFAWRDGMLTRTRWRPRAGRDRHRPAGRAGDVRGVPGGHDRPGLHQPAIDRAARLRRRPGRAGHGGRVTRLLARSRRWRRRIQRLNGTVITVYLWHFAPVLVIAAALYPEVREFAIGEFAASDGRPQVSTTVTGCARPQAASASSVPRWRCWRSWPAGMSSNTGWRSASARKSSTGESLVA